MGTSFEKNDEVVLNDKHSESDGGTGTVMQVIENVFGEPIYTISFDGGQEIDITQDQFEAADGDGTDEADEEQATSG